MARTTTVQTLRDRAARYSPAQRRTVAAALPLFAIHGVGGTSLQMIADSLGITKAAVYHQFSTKDAIVLAVIEVELQPLEAAIDDARSADELLARVIDTVIANRHALGTLQNDPVLSRLLGEHEPSRRLWVRLFSELVGNDLDPPARVRAAVLSAAIGSAAHPFVVDLDDHVVAAELLRITRSLLPPSD